MSQFQPHDPWRPQGALRTTSATRAAVFVWIVGALQTLAFGCCSGFLGFFTMLPQEQLNELFADHPMRDSVDLSEVSQMAPMAALLCLLLGFLPGVAYLILGFAVKARKPLLINFTLMLLLTQTIVWGLLLLSTVAVGIATGNPADITINVLTIGTLLALIIAAMVQLLRLKRGNVDDIDDQADPWNEPPQ